MARLRSPIISSLSEFQLQQCLSSAQEGVIRLLARSSRSSSDEAKGASGAGTSRRGGEVPGARGLRRLEPTARAK